MTCLTHSPEIRSVIYMNEIVIDDPVFRVCVMFTEAIAALKPNHFQISGADIERVDQLSNTVFSVHCKAPSTGEITLMVSAKDLETASGKPPSVTSNKLTLRYYAHGRKFIVYLFLTTFPDKESQQLSLVSAMMKFVGLFASVLVFQSNF